MKLHQLTSNYQKKAAKRLGRGVGSGKGRTSTRGHNGQKSRSGFNIPNRFEGGQTSLIQRLPKTRGFKSFNIKPIAINYKALSNKFADNGVVSPKSLYHAGLVDSNKLKIKILGPKVGKKIFIFKNCLMSKTLAKSLTQDLAIKD